MYCICLHLILFENIRKINFLTKLVHMMDKYIRINFTEVSEVYQNETLSNVVYMTFPFNSRFI